MTRENDIRIEAMNYEETNPEATIVDAFEAGASYSDAHPSTPWVSVADYLPTKKPYSSKSIPVVVCYDDGDIAIDEFDYDKMAWVDGSENYQEITHWMNMPLPNE